jgi:hypothetical protein
MRKFSRSLAFVSAFAFVTACGDDPPPDPTGTAPKITSTAVLAAKQGELYSYMVTITGNPSPALAATNKPAWLTLEGRLLSGTPTLTDVGMHMVTLSATNGVSPNATQTFTITVTAGDTTAAPLFTSTAPTTAAVGVAYTYAVTTSGTPSPEIVAGTLPSWLSFDAATNTLSGTPAAGDVGDHAITLTASNGISPDATQTFTIAVASNSVAPSFTSTPITAANAEQAYSYTPTASGTPNPTITATMLPSWLTFTGGVLSGTPSAGDAGDHDVVLTAANGASPDATQSFTITVAPLPQTAPTFTSVPPASALAGTAISYTATADGNPTPSITATTLPAWLSFDTATGILSGTPAVADVGDHLVELTAANGIAPAAVQSFTINVSSTGVAPSFTSTPITTAVEGALYSYSVTADGTPTPTLAPSAMPGWLSFDAATGVLSGTPTAANIGAHNIELIASNGIAPNATQIFTIQVTAGTAPAITSTPVTTGEDGQPYSYQVTATGNPPAVITATVLPAWLTIDATGLLSGTPATTDVGLHNVVISAANGVGTAATQAFTINVLPAPSAPVFTSTPVTDAPSGQPYSYTAFATGNPVPVLSASSAGGGALPVWLAFDAATGVLAGTPTPADVGDFQIEITAANGTLPDAVQAFTISVAVVTTPPAITSVAVLNAQAGLPYSYTIVATGEPAPAIAVTGLPAWLTFNGTNRITGSPGVADVGDSPLITVTADNGIAPAATQSFTISVAPLGVIAIAGNPYAEDFDGGAIPAGWTAVGTWQVGAATAGLPAVGPPYIYDGAMAATNLTGNYVNSANWTFTTPAFDFTGVTAPTLRFAHWHNFEKATVTPFTNYDGGNIKISFDGGATFTEVVATSVTPAYTGAMSANNVGIPNQQGWSGILPDWQLASVDLAPSLAGQPLTNVMLRFAFGSDGSVPRPGWYVDAIRVAEASTLVAPAQITSTPPTPLTFLEGTPFSYTVVATGDAPVTLSASGAAGAPLPSWLTFDAATGVLSGTPATADGGAHVIEITASNAERPSAVQRFTITVIPIVVTAGYSFEGDVRAPTTLATGVTASDFNNRAGNTTFVAGNPGRAINSGAWVDAVDPNYYEFTITPPTGQQIRFTALNFDHYRSATGPTNFQVSLVQGATVTPLTAGAGTVPNATTWTPANITFTDAEDGGYPRPITIRIAAWGASAAGGTFRLDNVALVGVITTRDNEAPVFVSTAPTTAQVGVPYSYPIITDGWPVAAITTSGLPAWLTYSSATRTLSGTPTGLFVGTSGTITLTANNAITPNATQAFTITVAPAPALPVANGTPVTQGFGTAIPAGWAANGGWEFGIPTVGLPAVGPPTVLDGELAATRLNGTYDTSVRWSMTTPVFDLTTVTNPVLQFTHWYNFERSASGPAFTCYDGANLKISTDGGLTFVQLQPATVSPAYTCALAASVSTTMNGQQGWGGISTEWTFVSIDLATNLAGLPLDRVMIRFDLGSDSSTNRPGWYVDNVRLGASGDLTQTPSITSVPRMSAREGVAYNYVLSGLGVPAPAFTVTSQGGGPLPAWLTYTPATRTLAGTPAAADVGTHNISAVATNSVGSVTQDFSITVFAAAAPPVVSETFESGASTWTIGFDEGTATEWQIGTPIVLTPAIGPAACFAGTMCAGTNLGGEYAEEERISYLQSPVMDLTGLPHPALRFHHWYITEATYDGGNVKISTDGGVTFSALTAGSVVPAYTGALDIDTPMGGQLAWHGTASTWATVNVDLAANLVGLPRDQIVVRFDFASDVSVNYAGWYIDDVSAGDFVTLLP